MGLTLTQNLKNSSKPQVAIIIAGAIPVCIRRGCRDLMLLSAAGNQSRPTAAP
jgi:hypothetical protein